MENRGATFARFCILFCICRPILPHFGSGAIFYGFSYFSHFWGSAHFHCVPGPHDCNTKALLLRAGVWSTAASQHPSPCPAAFLKGQDRPWSSLRFSGRPLSARVFRFIQALHCTDQGSSLRRAKKDLEWQCSNKRSQEQFGTMWGNRTGKCRVSRQKGPESSTELCHEHCHRISLPCFLRLRKGPSDDPNMCHKLFEHQKFRWAVRLRRLGGHTPNHSC